VQAPLSSFPYNKYTDFLRRSCHFYVFLSIPASSMTWVLSKTAVFVDASVEWQK